MADKLLIPIEVAGAVELVYAVGAMTKIKFFAPAIVADSLADKLAAIYYMSDFERVGGWEEPPIEGATYYVPPPSRFLPADATPEQQLEAISLFRECCDRVRWSHRRALAGEKVGLPRQALSPLLMDLFRYYSYFIEFNAVYEDAPLKEVLESRAAGVNFNEDERFYVQRIIEAITSSH